MKKLLSLSLVFLGILLFAQSKPGIVRGIVYSENNGEKLMGIGVLVDGVQMAMTDLDGAYSFEMSPGTYAVTFEDFDFQSFTFDSIAVKSGEVTVLDDAFLFGWDINAEGDSISNSVNLNTVVVTASVNRDSERALIYTKKKSSVILDGVSAAKMELAGDGTAVEAAKRVTGVSIEGGKYVYVRGLGDRYSKTTLNGIDIPGLDPDRNTLQMDIFPSNLMDNIMVSKNFTADLSADFTGGIVNIETKAFPTKRILNISYGLGITPGMTFNRDYLYYKGGNTDFLGFDDGTRALPNGAEGDFPTPINSNSSPDATYNFIGQFNKTLGASRKPAFMNQDFSISYGDQFRLENDNKIAVMLGFNYKNETQYYDDYQYGDYQRLQSDPSRMDLVFAKTKTGEQGVNSVLMGVLGGASYKTNKSRYSLNVMHLQNGESTAGRFFVNDSDDAVGHSGFTAGEDDLLYNQRALTNIILQGVHKSSSGNFELEWKLSPTFSKNEDPDIRKTAFTYESIDTLFSSGAGGNPIRIWRKLDEFAGVGKLDMTQKYNKGQIKIGGAYIYKEREFSILQYLMQFWSPQNWSSYNFNDVMNDENLYPNSPNGIWFSNGNPNPNTNAYESKSSTMAGYVSNEYELFDKLKTVLGVRVENFVLSYTGANQDGEYENDQERINSTNFFPTANLIFAVNDKMNLRLGYARTIARPSFKEASYAEIYDPLTDRTFIGGLWGIGSWDGGLKETNIDNFDLRWELFPSGDQIFSVSGFYKSFQSPIELVRIITAQTGNHYQPRNVGNGKVYGIELEFKKHLGFISEGMKSLSLSSNVTIAKSEIEMTEEEFTTRKKFQREGENIKNKRDMAGQAPYVINAGIEYLNSDRGLQTGLFYNVRGKSLSIVGTGLFPDVYAQPFNSLNFTINKKFGKHQNTKISLQVSNILDDKEEDWFESYNAPSEIFESKKIGRTFSLGFSYDF